MPGSTSVTGLTGSALQSANIRQHGITNQDLLIDECAKANGFSEDCVRASARDPPLNGAVQFMHRLLLKDTQTPPWLQHACPLVASPAGRLGGPAQLSTGCQQAWPNSQQPPLAPNCASLP